MRLLFLQATLLSSIVVLSAGPGVADQAVVVSGTGPQELVAGWRVLSQRLFYDQGGGGTLLSAANGTATTRLLELRADGEWRFGHSKGKWSVSSITEADWKRWGINSFGPTRKIILEGWQGNTADGPIEESTGVDFLWVLYRVQPPAATATGTVHLKLGRTSEDLDQGEVGATDAVPADPPPQPR